MRKSLLISLPVIALLLSTTAHADDLFSLSDNAGDTLTFSLPSSPTPTDSNSGTFVVDNINYILNGVSGTGGFSFTVGGGWAIGGPNFSLTDVSGGNYFGRFQVDNNADSFFTGDPGTPTFLTGTFTGTARYLPLDPGSGTNYTLTITPSAVPEPSSLLLFSTGFASLAGIGRRVRQRAR